MDIMVTRDKVPIPDPISIFEGTTGLNNRLRPDELSPKAAEACTDMVIDDEGYPSKRPGFSLITSGLFHSLPQEDDVPYVGKDRVDEQDSAIYLIAPDDTLKGVCSGLTQCAHVSFMQLGEKTYWANGYEKGYMVEDKAFAWVTGETEADDTNIYSKVPIGTHIEKFGGRAMIVVGDTVYFSELYRPDLFILHKNYIRFPAPIVMMRAVENGIFISTSKSIYFIKGEISDIMNSKLVSTYPAIEWTDKSKLVDASKYGFSDSALCVIFTATDGVNLGLPDGRLVKVNYKDIKYPNNLTAGAGLLVGHLYIHSMT